MERLQGPINSCFLEEPSLDLGCLDQVFINTESLRFGEEEPHILSPCFEDKMPYLQMLQTVETPPFFPYKEPSFQTLQKLQHLKKPWNTNTFYMPETDTQVQPLELESCVTHDIVDLHSPVKSETKEHPNPHSNSCLEGVSPEPKEPNSDSSIPWRAQPQTVPNITTHFSESSTIIITRERRKRKRKRATKNKEEVESQRMNHIAVERNRRRLMNDHLNSLRSLMTPSYIQKGDQASIIGGAIDFVKELEQLVQSLEAHKQKREIETASTTGISSNRYSTSQPQCDILVEGGTCEEERTVKKKSEATEIEVAAVQNHVNLKIKCPRIPGQLLRAIVALEDLGLTVLHLNITSSQATVLYSFNLKLEDDCKLGSTDEVAAAAHQIIFSSING